MRLLAHVEAELATSNSGDLQPCLAYSQKLLECLNG
jgi:hypothetical protein